MLYSNIIFQILIITMHKFVWLNHYIKKNIDFCYELIKKTVFILIFANTKNHKYDQQQKG